MKNFFIFTMAEGDCKTVRPFRGWLYSPKFKNEMSKIICPPYDIIDSELSQKLLEMHPYNYVRVVLSPSGNKEAGKFLKKLIEEGKIFQDKERRIYVLSQSWGHKKKMLGIIAEVDINSKILAHEATDGEVIQNRVELIKITGFITCPIFLVSSKRFTDKIKSFTKLFTFTDEIEGLFVEFGYVDDISICRELEGATFLIADGHHRFQAIRRVFSESKDRYFMAFITDENQINIFPFHRVFPASFFKQVLQKLKEHAEFLGERERLTEDERWTFALFDGKKFYLFLKNFSDKLPSEFLHEYILTGIQDIDFEADTKKVLRKVEGGGKVAIFLKAVEIEKIWDYSRKGKILPRKSTYFWPKIPSGLVLQKLEKLEGEIWKEGGGENR